MGRVGERKRGRETGDKKAKTEREEEGEERREGRENECNFNKPS